MGEADRGPPWASVTSTLGGTWGHLLKGQRHPDKTVFWNATGDAERVSGKLRGFSLQGRKQDHPVNNLSFIQIVEYFILQ